jgi:hypothetical protein
VLRAFYFRCEFVLKAYPRRQSPEAECRVHGLGVEIKEAFPPRAADSPAVVPLPRGGSCCRGVSPPCPLRQNSVPPRVYVIL